MRKSDTQNSGESRTLTPISSELLYRVSEPIFLHDAQNRSNSAYRSLFGSDLSDATAYIPSPRLRAEKAPLKRSKLLTFCNLTRKRKRTRPCNDCPTSSRRHDPKSAPGDCLFKLDRREYGAFSLASETYNSWLLR
jgi:hypothetical protein